ncbi:hypothetical protein JOF53_007696 [Crossiella equi]|uniref:Uncharacterized protein n=1 Tax=Crossiella equi TaxID=130796 RepID=A0ABS5ARH6_9PSEU|nr:hypothetical protein [Crossiella equi]
MRELPRHGLLRLLYAVLLSGLLTLAVAPVASAQPSVHRPHEVAVSVHLGGSSSDHRDTRLNHPAERVAVANPQAHQHFWELPSGLPVVAVAYPGVGAGWVGPDSPPSVDQVAARQAPTRGPPFLPGK